MQVTKIVDGDGDISYSDIPKPTNAEMQREYDYLLAEQMTRNLLNDGLISQDEFDKIMVQNRRSFSPLLSKIGAKIT